MSQAARTRRRRAFATAALFAILVVLGLGSAPAGRAQEALDLTMQSVEVTEAGDTEVVVDVQGVPPGSLDGSAFTVTEAGEPVGKVTAELASELEDPDPRFVVLAMDVSDSTQGAPRRNAVTAAKAFAETVIDRGVEVGVVQFSIDARLLEPPTTDLAAVEAALDDLTGGSQTRLYDGVVVAARTLANFIGERTIVVFSDGADIGSEASLDGAASAASLAGASVTSVALNTQHLDPAALESLANGTDGRVIQVDTVGDLSAAFAEVARDLNSRYVLTYPSTGLTGQFDVEVGVQAQGASDLDTMPVLNTIEAPVSVAPNVIEVEADGVFSADWIPPVAVGTAFVALLLVAWSLFVPTGNRQVARNLQAAIGGDKGGDGGIATEDFSPATAAMSRRAIELIERVPRPEGYDEAVQQRLDRAGWPLRSTEFTTLLVLGSLVGFGLGWALLGNVLFGLVLGLLGWVLPGVVLSARVSARQRRFMAQLPDTLQLFAGSLKAGYGVLQAIDTVVKETGEPSRSEFQRVLAEARLGLPLEEALEDMATRIGVDDFRWVTVSISIQRRVGGNLAQLLETVAATLREREATRRQIKSLSAEGRLSAVILTVLPFGLAGYMYMVNPEYLSPLWTTGMGQVMLAAVTLLMIGGVLWMRNMIRIDV